MSDSIQIQTTPAPGFLCPACQSFRIRLSLEAFLSSQDVTCGNCGQTFHMDKSSCAPFVEKLQDLYVAHRNVELLRRQSL